MMIAELGGWINAFLRRTACLGYSTHLTESYLLDSRRTEVVSQLPNSRIRMPFSHDLALVYVLHRSGCVGRLNSGRVSRDGATGLNVYDSYGRLVEYLSGSTSRVRSWCVVESTGNPVQGWLSVSIEDVARFIAVPISAQ